MKTAIHYSFSFSSFIFQMKEEYWEREGEKKRQKGEGDGGWRPRWDGYYLTHEGIQGKQMNRINL